MFSRKNRADYTYDYYHPNEIAVNKEQKSKAAYLSKNIFFAIQ